MTLEEMRGSSKEMLTCQDLSEIFRCSAYNLHLQATQRPEMLPIAPLVIGTRVLFPRRAVIRYMETGKAEK